MTFVPSIISSTKPSSLASDPCCLTMKRAESPANFFEIRDITNRTTRTASVSQTL